MWVPFVIAALLARTSIANLEAKDIQTLPNRNVEDDSFSVFTKQTEPSSSKPVVAKTWKTKHFSSPQNDEDKNEEDNLTVGLESMPEQSPNTEAQANKCRTNWYKFIIRHFSKLNMTPKHSILTTRDDKNENDLNSTNSNGRRKRSANEVDIEDTATMKKRSTGPPITWMDWPNEDRIVSAEEPSDQSQEKTSSVCKPWGGKRIAVYRLNPKIRRPIRVPFNSWGGKRDDEGVKRQLEEEKKEGFFHWGGKRKTPFNSWGGKRFSADNLVNGRVPFFEWGGKRVPFGSWGGKRVPFGSWGGKRDWDQVGLDRLIGDDLEQKMDKRAKFYFWGGKRSKNEETDDEETKRTKFYAWGGKRSDSFDNWYSKRVPEETVERRNLLDNWGNTRLAEKMRTSDEIDENGIPQNEERKRLGFDNWDGKKLTSLMTPRNNEMDGTYTTKTDNDWPVMSGNRADSYHKRMWAFVPWDEKRSENGIDATNNDAIFTTEPFFVPNAFFPWGG